MKTLRKVHTYIPGFRQLKPDAMVIAATYYGASVFVLLRYWYWGIALLAAPFLIFNLVELRSSSKRGLTAATAVAAGLLVMLGAACALSAGGVQGGSGTSPSAAVYAAKTLQPPASPSAALALSPSPAPNPGNAQYAYVASKGGGVFHLPGCPYAKSIKPQNLIGFQTRAEAIAAGLKPCSHCKP